MRIKAVRAQKFIEIGYDEKTCRLLIQFTKDHKLVYEKVPPEVYAELFNHWDKDAYYEKNIKYKFLTVHI